MPDESTDPRVPLAAERTLLAWIRTGLSMMGFGFVVARFGLFLREMAAAGDQPPARHLGLSLWIGTALGVLGIAVNVIAAGRHARFLGRLRRGEPYAPPAWSLGVVVAGVLATRPPRAEVVVGGLGAVVPGDKEQLSSEHPPISTLLQGRERMAAVS